MSDAHKMARKPKRDQAAEVAKLDYEAIDLNTHEFPAKDAWLREATGAHNTLLFAIEALKRSASENAEFAAREWDAMTELRDCVASLKKRYGGLVALLSAAEARILIGMARAAYGETPASDAAGAA